MTRHSRIILGAMTLLSVTLPCMASEPRVPEPAAWNGELQAENYRGIRYLTGGVGHREQEHIKELAADYDLLIVMTSDTGAYLSGVELVFRDAQGRDVLLATSNGPFFLIDLPDGRYEVTARRPRAASKSHTAQVDGGKTQTIAFKLSAPSS